MQVCNAAHTDIVWERLVGYREGWHSTQVPAPDRWVLRLLSRGPYIHSCSDLLRSSNQWETPA